jgi:hypothetical protein
MRRTILFLLLLISVGGGCRVSSPVKSTDRGKDEFCADTLWRQGYGFNNPNLERMRTGLKPVNFDGREHNAKSIMGDSIADFFGSILSELFRR